MFFRDFLSLAILLVEYSLLFKSLINEIANIYAPNARKMRHAICWSIIISNKTTATTATKYPVGFFQSNGNLIVISLVRGYKVQKYLCIHLSMAARFQHNFIYDNKIGACLTRHHLMTGENLKWAFNWTFLAVNFCKNCACFWNSIQTNDLVFRKWNDFASISHYADKICNLQKLNENTTICVDHKISLQNSTVMIFIRFSKKNNLKICR